MAFGASPAVAESQIGLYGGWNGSFDSDIHLSQPNGTNMTLNGVPWDGDSFGAPPYWGLRGTYWLNSAPNWGVMIDYSHAKVIADRARWSVSRAAATASSWAPWTASATHSKSWSSPTASTRSSSAASIVGCMSAGRLVWGSALAFLSRMSRCVDGAEQFPHPRISARWGGGRRAGKLSFSSSDAELNGGGSLETDVSTNHVTFGASYRFGAAPEPYQSYQ